MPAAPVFLQADDPGCTCFILLTAADSCSTFRNQAFCWTRLDWVHKLRAGARTLGPNTCLLRRLGLGPHRPPAPRPLRRRPLRTVALRSRSCTRCAGAHRSTTRRSVPTQTAPAQTNYLAPVAG